MKANKSSHFSMLRHGEFWVLYSAAPFSKWLSLLLFFFLVYTFALFLSIIQPNGKRYHGVGNVQLFWRMIGPSLPTRWATGSCQDWTGWGITTEFLPLGPCSSESNRNLLYVSLLRQTHHSYCLWYVWWQQLNTKLSIIHTKNFKLREKWIFKVVKVLRNWQLQIVSISQLL